MRANHRPTKAELEILQVLWASGALSVREIHGLLNESKSTGYTSVLKTLQIMTDKGLVHRDEHVRPQIYRARFSQGRTQRQLLKDLLQRVYGGSVSALVLQAVGTRRCSREDLDAIKALLARVERSQR